MNILKSAFAAVFAVLSLSLLSAGAQNDKDWARFGKYENDNAQVTAKPKAVIMGDSITEGWAKKDPDFFTANNILGRGISGQTSYQFLLRFRNDVINLKPKLVIINGGTNDVAENTGAFDIETTSFFRQSENNTEPEKVAIMYVWTFSICGFCAYESRKNKRGGLF